MIHDLPSDPDLDQLLTVVLADTSGEGVTFRLPLGTEHAATEALSDALAEHAAALGHHVGTGPIGPRQFISQVQAP